MLILGESGFGKTYTICCLLAELSERGVHSARVRLRTGLRGGFRPQGIGRLVRPVEIAASLEGIDVNPLQIFSTDILGPVNVARACGHLQPGIYELGVQQHSVLRQAVLDVFSGAGIMADSRKRGGQTRPPSARCMRNFRSLQRFR